MVIKLERKEIGKRTAALTITAALVVALIVGALVYSTPRTIPQALADDIERIRMGIHVVAKSPDGTVKGEYDNPDDIATNQFAILMAGFFTEHGGTTLAITLKDITNANRSPILKASASQVSLWSTSLGLVGGYMGIGNSSGAPAIADYNLGMTVGALTPTTSSTYANGNVTIVSTVTVTSAQGVGIQEAGLFVRMQYSSTLAYFLMFRDTFTAIPVSISDTVTVTYTIYLQNTGFNDNFGLILADFFASHIQDSDVTLSLKATTGGTLSINTWGDAWANWLFDNGVGASNNAGMRVGTSSAAVQRNNTSLGTDVSANIAGNSLPVIIPSGTTNNITFASNFILGSSYSIVEAGYFVTTKDSGGANYELMFWRTTFTAYSYIASDVMAVTFRFRC